MVRQKLINTLPERALNPFLNDPSFIGKGFEMWERLCRKNATDGPLAVFTTFMQLFELRQGSTEDWGDYMAKVRGIDNLLRGKTVTDLMVLFAIFAADGSRYNELVNSFRRGDATVLKADLSQLETMGDAIDSRRNAEKAFSGGNRKPAAANRATGTAPAKPSGPSDRGSGGDGGGGGE